MLYVEDNEYNRKIVRHLLSRTSFRLREAADGEAGLRMVADERPDLVLMDVQLPKMSGLDATRALRGDPATADIPIIVVTSFALSGDDRAGHGGRRLGLPGQAVQSPRAAGADPEAPARDHRQEESR